MILKQKRTRVFCKGLAWVLFLTISVLIFGFSHQTAEESSKVSQTVLSQLLEKFVSGYKEMPKTEQEALINRYHSLIRKAAHLGIYALWGWSFTLLLFLYGKRRRTMAAMVLCGGFFYAGSDELHQIFTNGRAGMLSDVLIDTLGVALGFLSFFIFLKIANYFLRNIKKTLTDEKIFSTIIE